MKLIVFILLIVAFCIGYEIGYAHGYKPLHDKLQAIQAEDWQKYTQKQNN